MNLQVYLEKPKIFQVHDRIYLEQEIRIESPAFADLLSLRPKSLAIFINYLLRRSLKIGLPADVDSLFIDGAELSKIEVSPSHVGAKLEKKHIVLSGRRLRDISTIKIGMQFVLPPDKLFNFLAADVLDRVKTDNGYTFTVLVKNKKDWPIEYVKMHLQVLTKEALKKSDLCALDLDTHTKRILSSDVLTAKSHIDRFKSLDSRTYTVEVEFRDTFDPDAQIEVYINDSSLTKAESIVFVPGSMLDSLKKFYDLLGTLENEICWFEGHVDKDCFDFLSKGINKEKIRNIHIIGGPIHMNEQFKQFYTVFKKDMSSNNISVEAKAILDENILGLMHGRFLFDQNRLYLVPPSNIVSKKFDAVALVSDVGDSQKTRAKIQEIWKNSTPISNWKKIQEKRQSLDPRSF